MKGGTAGVSVGGAADGAVGLEAGALVLTKVGTVDVIPNVGALATDLGGLGTGAGFMLLTVGKLFIGYLKFCPVDVTAVGGTNGLALGATGTRFGTVVCGPSTFKTEEDEGVCP